MPDPLDAQPSDVSSRRRFLTVSAATTAAVGAGLLGRQAISPPRVHAAGGDLLKIGLIGCGGRGTGAAVQALSAGGNVKLTAMGDAFADRLQASLEKLEHQAPSGTVAVAPDHCFVGFGAYQQVIDSGVDVVLLCTPPHFRPEHFRAAVAAGKHAFVEKPAAVDAPGVRSVLATAEEAKQRGLSVVSGLCYRYDLPKRETIQRIYDGAIGEIVAINVNYNSGTLWTHPRKPEWSDMEWQLRNWLYFTWLSGDHIVEQHIHSLDKAAWAMKDEPPVKAWGLGGRQVRVQPEFGQIFDHHAVVYEYASGVRLFAFTRQQAGCSVDVSDYVLGTKGTADVMHHTIKAETKWRYRGPKPNMYQVEHDELFAAIRSGKRVDNTQYMCSSTMLAILGRMCTYTGQTITWDEALNSDEDLTPPSYEWGSLPVAPAAMPGITPFV
ncbi:MAG TPA: Gfo/Idh/MocA family oxidoreductase [Pirellulales bacterium]|nr:Gfo/Idh/MocA family oxidoreductase [Pirellulales bacterium]